MVTERRQHCDKSVASVRQGKNAEFVEDERSIGDSRKQPAEVFLINTLREEGDNSEKPSGIRAKLLEHWGGE
jgi:hypothetical protein